MPETDRSGEPDQSLPQSFPERLQVAEDEERRAQGLPPIDRKRWTFGSAAPAAAFGHQRAGERLLLTILWCSSGLAALACIVGLLLIVLGSSGVTTFQNSNSRFSTTNVGLAALAIGALMFAFCARTAARTMADLARVKPEIGLRVEGDVVS